MSELLGLDRRSNKEKDVETPFLIVHQQRRVFTHPHGPQVERHRHGPWVTGEGAVAALLITPAFISAADVGDASAKPM